MINMNLPEILSPVGNEEMLTAAVRSGADAVYLGAKEFSARRNAENFDLEELKKAIEYCHIRGVRVYLTLNILIKDTEMESAFNLARDVYNAGVDGIIIQDLGLAR
ncbi:MAG: peptidase U32, partial [Acutalibacteraceae bacterium]|nr:peptidase U32 [Acutalibacteraceae bacterium]